MRIMYKDVLALDSAQSIAEILAVDEISNMERILHNEGYDELPDLPGIMCTCATVNCYNEKILYDSIYIVCKNEKVVKNIMSKIFKEDILDLSDQDDMCKCIYNATPQELYDLLKAATDLWVTK